MASDENVLRRVKDMLTERFQMKDLGKLRHFLGVDFNQSDNCVRMSQAKYVTKYCKGLTCRIANLDRLLVNKT